MCYATLDGGESHNLNALHRTGGVGHDLTGDADDAVERGCVLAEVVEEDALVEREVYVECAFLFAQHACAVIGSVL